MHAWALSELIPFQNFVTNPILRRMHVYMPVQIRRQHKHTHMADTVDEQTFRGIPVQRLLAFVRLERNVVIRVCVSDETDEMSPETGVRMRARRLAHRCRPWPVPRGPRQSINSNFVAASDRSVTSATVFK